MKLQIKKGTTSKLLDIFIMDSSSTTGAGLTGLVYNSAGLTAYYYREGAASATAITLATMTLGTWATGGFVVIDGTNMPGCYQIGIPDAALATGANSVVVMLKGATNMAPLTLEIDLVDNVVADTYSIVNDTNFGNAQLVRSTTPANTLDVSATGEAGLDFNNIKDATGAHTLTNITVPVTTSVTNDVGITQAGADKVWSATATVSGTSTAVDAIWDESLTGATHNVANSAGKRLRLLGATAVMSGTIPSQAGMAINAITLDAGASATSHIYTEALLVIDTGVAIGEGHHILSYNGTTKVAIIDDAWITQPVAGDTYQIYASSAFDAVTGLAQAGGANTITLQSIASASNDLYLNQSIYIPSGTGAGQRRRITAYNGTTKVATVSSNWIINPDNTSAYMIYEGNQVSVDINTDKTGYAIGAGGIVPTSFAAGAIDAASLSADATTEITAGIRIKKNTALANFMFLMVDSTDHITPKTGLTITATRSIDGAVFAACVNSATEVANGMYKINLAATDLNGDVITLRFTGTGADARLITIVTTT